MITLDEVTTNIRKLMNKRHKTLKVKMNGQNVRDCGAWLLKNLEKQRLNTGVMLLRKLRIQRNSGLL